MDPVTRWLLTYLLHSTLLLGGAALATVLLGRRHLALQEALLRAALLGGFLTASLQIGLELRPLGGTLAIPRAQTAALASAADTTTGAAGPVAAVSPSEFPTAEAATSGGDAVERWNVPALVSHALHPWPRTLLAVWGGLALLALARLAIAAGRLRHLLHGRRAVADASITSRTRAVGQALGLRRPALLSAAPRIDIPLATGVLRPEVCLPTRALEELPDEERLALCAHELAHLARRDPAWLLIVRVAQAVAPLQPLNAWARRRLEDLAECLSDDLAVSAAARPIGLARSLVDVASWALSGRPVLPATAAGAFRARSRLALRVERIMDPVRRLERPRRFLLPAAIIAVLATVLVIPAVSGRSAMLPLEVYAASEAPPPPAAPPAPPAPAAPPAPVAAPAPAAAPAPPAPPAPPATEEAERRLERLSQRIAARTDAHQAEMDKLEAEIEALTADLTPMSEEMTRLGAQMGEIASEIAETALDRSADESDMKHNREKRAEAKKRMAELRRQMKESAARMHIPEEKMHALQEKAHALAELARPTDEELAEIRQLSHQIAHEMQPRGEEMARIAREAAEQAREAMQAAREEMQRAKTEAHRAQKEAMRAQEEALRAAHDAMREAEKEMHRQQKHATPHPTEHEGEAHED